MVFVSIVRIVRVSFVFLACTCRAKCEQKCDSQRVQRGQRRQRGGGQRAQQVAAQVPATDAHFTSPYNISLLQTTRQAYCATPLNLPVYIAFAITMFVFLINFN